ncbi:MAG TPA: single-stranded DNA-binding protein [Niabella sp.]|nr:single-stranded DNA-binding protein [Niabella sp.]
MQTIIGRLTADAIIATLEDGRTVVNFTIAQNDRLKVKGSDEVKQLTNYYNCAYWMGTGIASHLKKGMLVEAAGRIGVNAWQGADGTAKARLTLHVQHIQLHGKAKTAAPSTDEPAPETQSEKEDLPF